MRDALRVMALISSLIVAAPALAQSGNAANGNTLYHASPKYNCVACHTATPGPNSGLSNGATVGGLLNAISTVAPMSTRYSLSLANNPGDLADIAAYLAQVTGAVAAKPDLNQHGLTGSWYEPATSGQGLEVEVFADLDAPGSGLTQVSWFTFDTVAGGAERQRWYTASGPVVTGQAQAALTIYQNTGGNFDAAPVTSAVPVGTATLSFDSCTSGQFAYSFSDGSGRVGTVALSRLTQSVTCSTTAARPVDADFSFSGNWYDPATSGQGITAEINAASGVAFFAWYTYAPGGTAAGAAGQRWYTGQGNYAAGTRAIPLTLYATTGGVFDTPTTPAPATVAVGTATLTFQSCTSATLTFAFTGGTSAGAAGTISMARIGPVPKGCTL